MAVKAIIKVGHGKDCPYCGRVMSIDGLSDSDPYPTRDHIRSRQAGGGLRIIVCRKCNLDKAARSLKEWHQALTQTGDERAPVVAAFIELAASNGHLAIIRHYEEEANKLHWKEKGIDFGQWLLDTRERRRAKKARRKGLNRKRDRLGDGDLPQ